MAMLDKWLKVGLFAATLCVQPVLGHAEETQRFGDWVMKCETAASGGSRNCLITQLVSMESGGTQVLSVAIGYAPGNPRPQVAFNIPPQTEKEAGLTFKVDDGDTFSVPVDLCNAQLCMARDYLAPEVEALMKGGNSAIVTYKIAGQEQRVGVPLSLKGFTAALNAISEVRAQ